jgi:prolyl oligopeptidase
MARPPATRKGPDRDLLHGAEIADPYRWLEDPNAPEVRAWVDEQNQISEAFLAGPHREALLERLTKLWNYERIGVPFKEGGRYFYYKNDGLQNQAVLWTLPSLDAEARVLIDPNTLSADGTVALSGLSISRDGKLAAYGLSASGSDWQEWRVRDVATGVDLADHIQWVRFSGVTFTADGTGFFYSRYDAPAAGETHTAVALNQKLCFHRLGTPQADDQLVYARPDQPEWGFGAGVTEDGRYLAIDIWHGTSPRNRFFYRDLTADGPVVELLAAADASYHLIGNDGPRFWFLTDLDAPRRKVIEIDLRQPERSAWRELIPEREDALETVSFVGGKFLAHYLVHATSRIELFARDGAPLGPLPLPGLGSVGGLGGHQDDPETFFAFTSFTTPTSIYRYDVATGKTTLFRAPKVDFDPAAYETRQVFATSRDGTRVPMFLVHKKGLAPGGDHPTLLYGYGGFGISLTPAFEVSRLVWMEQGGIHAIANLRGGGEYGEAWRLAGTKHARQNVFDDFIACAEWLVGEKWTTPSRLAISGSSNGGLLVGACLTQRPELYGAALPDVGVLDMLRFHKFTIGWAWISDYGSPDDPEDFAVLRRYSPLHNVREGVRYPAVMVTTADTDDRVVAAHSYKFAAALQAVQPEDAPPILLRVDVRAGHGAGKPTKKIIAAIADRQAFLARALDLSRGR